MKAGSIEAKKFTVGERITFEDYIIKPCETRFGISEMIAFADDKGNIIRKTFAGGLSDFLAKNPGIKSVCLKKVLKDGEFTTNLWTT